MKGPKNEDYTTILKGCGWMVAVVICVIWIVWLASRAVPGC